MPIIIKNGFFMFMLTHTYFLQKVLEAAHINNIDSDIYVYNIIPDLLPMHPEISSNKTHRILRSMPIPEHYAKCAYVMFHLLVDDLAHYGYISSDDEKKFNFDSQGYCYMKGKPLVKPIIDLHKIIKKEISIDEAAYQSHLIIEMIYDLVISHQIASFNTIDVLVEGINFTVKNKMDEFISTTSWVFDIEANKIREVMKNVAVYLTKDRLEQIMNIESRIHLYKDKFGLKSDDQLFYDSLRNLFQNAKCLIDDDETFYCETIQTIKKYMWRPNFI